MDSKTVLLPEELQALKDQQAQYSKTINELGILNLQKSDLQRSINRVDQELENTLKDINSLRVKAEELQTSLVEKYGNIDVDLNTGEFIVLNN